MGQSCVPEPAVLPVQLLSHLPGYIPARQRPAPQQDAVRHHRGDGSRGAAQRDGLQPRGGGRVQAQAPAAVRGRHGAVHVLPRALPHRQRGSVPPGAAAATHGDPRARVAAPAQPAQQGVQQDRAGGAAALAHGAAAGDCRRAARGRAARPGLGGAGGRAAGAAEAGGKRQGAVERRPVGAARRHATGGLYDFLGISGHRCRVLGTFWRSFQGHFRAQQSPTSTSS